MTDVLELIVLDEALDWSPRCEWGGLRSEGRFVSPPGCARDAVWVGTALCCGRVKFYCDEHKRERQSFVSSRPAVTHRECGARGAPMRFEPLKGGA